MVARRRNLLLASFLIGTAFAAPVPPNAQNLPVYFPTNTGAKWVYQYDGGEVTHVVTAIEERDGAKVVTVAREDSGETIPLWTVQVSEKGVFQITSKETQVDPPLCWLKLPAKQGEVWKVDQEAPAGGKMKGVVTIAGTEKLQLPAGTYIGVRVDWDYNLDGKTQNRSYWYAPEVGLVKVKGEFRDMVLKSFTPGK